MFALTRYDMSARAKNQRRAFDSGRLGARPRRALVPPKPVRITQAGHPQGYCPGDSSRIGAASLRLNVSERCAHPMAEREKGATVMGSIQFKSLRRYLFGGLTLLVLVRLASAADAQPNLSPSEQYPGPWLEVTQEIREVLALRKVSACSQAVGRQSSRNARSRQAPRRHPAT